MKPNKKNKDSQITGFIGSLLVHLLLFLVLIFTGIITTVPEEEEGLTVNYGTSDGGKGFFEPAPQKDIEDQLVPETKPVTPAAPPVVNTPTPSQPDLATQDIEESLEMKAEREKAEKEKELERQRQEELRKQQEAEAKRLAEEKRIAEEKRKAEEAKKKAQEEAKKKAQSAGKVFGSGGKGTNTSSTGEGTTGTAGNQGNPLGSAESTNRNGGGTGNGHSYNLNGRSIKGTLPSPAYSKNEEGVIVVTIEVNAAGVVISARAGAAGTTIGDATMRRDAEQAALKAKFNGISGNTIQTGTITYRYKLN
jgi:TonB family protein